MKYLWFILIATSLVGCGLGPQPTPISIPLASTVRPVIVDADLAVDDMLAILYLLARPDVNVRAITITGTGITRCAAGLSNMRALLETVGRAEIPIACGRETPLEGDHAFPKEWRDAAENFFGLNLVPTNTAAPKEDAVQLLSRTLQASDAKITILALGPFTNLADAFAQHPALTQKIEMLYSMGGAVHVAGNVTQAPAAEWNFYCDPLALEQVLATNVPFTVVPLDTTNSVPVTRQAANNIQNQAQTPAAKLAARLVASQRSDIEAGAIYFWDSLSAVILTDESFSTIQEMKIKVQAADGQTIEDKAGRPVRVVTKIDVSRFEPMFLQTLNGVFQ